MSTKVGDPGTAVIDKADTKFEHPRMFKVILHNDDDTPMDFVVAVLQQIFHLPEASAFTIMMSVHKSGKGIAGVFTKEVAETKAHQVGEAAKKHEYPLLATAEPE